MQISELRAAIGRTVTADPSFDGSLTEFSALPIAQQSAISNGMKEYMRAHPTEFTSNQLVFANGANFSTSEAESYGLFNAAGDFVSEVGNQAVSLNDNLNPFSEKNRKWVLGVVAFGALLYFVGPAIIAALKDGKATK